MHFYEGGKRRERGRDCSETESFSFTLRLEFVESLGQLVYAAQSEQSPVDPVRDPLLGTSGSGNDRGSRSGKVLEHVLAERFRTDGGLDADVEAVDEVFHLNGRHLAEKVDAI